MRSSPFAHPPSSHRWVSIRQKGGEEADPLPGGRVGNGPVRQTGLQLLEEPLGESLVIPVVRKEERGECVCQEADHAGAFLQRWVALLLLLLLLLVLEEEGEEPSED